MAEPTKEQRAFAKVCSDIFSKIYRHDATKADINPLMEMVAERLAARDARFDVNKVACRLTAVLDDIPQKVPRDPAGRTWGGVDMDIEQIRADIEKLDGMDYCGEKVALTAKFPAHTKALLSVHDSQKQTIEEQAKKIEELEAIIEAKQAVEQAEALMPQNDARYVRRSTIDAVIEAGNRMDAGGIAVTEPVIIIPLSVLESMKGEPHDKK